MSNRKVIAAWRGACNVIEQGNIFMVFDAVFPEAEYPKARRYQSNGGPPGACMAFGAALRRMKASWGRPGDSVFIGIEEREAAVAAREAKA